MTSTVYRHPLSGESVLPILKQYLPASLPLYRRIQHPLQSEHAQIIATFPPGARSGHRNVTKTPVEAEPTDGTARNGTHSINNSTTDNALNGEHNTNQPLPPCFAIAYIDRSARPETELFLFSSGEYITSSNINTSSDINTTQEPISHSPPIPCPCSLLIPQTSRVSPSTLPSTLLSTPCATAILSLITYIATSIPFVPLTEAQHEDAYRAANLVAKISSTASSAASTTSKSKYYPDHASFLTAIPKSHLLKLGSSAALPTAVLAAAGYLESGLDAPHEKYILRISEAWKRGEGKGEGYARRQLPEGLRWGEVRERDIDAVRLRTPIPRVHATIRGLRGVAVFRDHENSDRKAEGERRGAEHDQPIAWAFLGKEGNLTSLHVEPEFRGRGIAKTVAAKLFAYLVGEDGWAHADVVVGNKESEGVCKGLGGEVSSWVWWLSVDLDAVRGSGNDV